MYACMYVAIGLHAFVNIRMDVRCVYMPANMHNGQISMGYDFAKLTRHALTDKVYVQFQTYCPMLREIHAWWNIAIYVLIVCTENTWNYALIKYIHNNYIIRYNKIIWQVLFW